MEDFGSISNAFDRSGIKMWELLSAPVPELAQKVGRSVNEITRFKNWYMSQVPVAKTVTGDTELLGKKSVSTGVPELNALLGGGLVSGSVTEISGTATVGKTCLCCQIAVTNAPSAVYLTSEDRFNTIRRRMADVGGHDPDSESPPWQSVFPPERFISVRDLTSLRIALATLKKRFSNVDVVIIDSLGAIWSHLDEREAQLEIEELGLRKTAHELRAAIVVINHVSDAKRPFNPRFSLDAAPASKGGSQSQSPISQQTATNAHTKAITSSDDSRSDADLFFQYQQLGGPSYSYRRQAFLVEGDSGPDREFQIRPKHAMAIADFIDTRLILMRLRSKSASAREAKIVFSKWALPDSLSLEMGQTGLRVPKPAPLNSI